MSEYVWQPSAEVVERANVTRLARRLGVDGYDALLARSVAEPASFWDAVVADLDLRFLEPYESVMTPGAEPWQTRWFDGGAVNIAHACAARWAAEPGHRDAIAVLWEGEDGSRRELSYGDLARDVARAAEALGALGVGEGDAVGLLLPMVPEAVIALLAVASLGALAVPIFSGFAADAVATRLRDSSAVALITVDAFPRRDRPVPAKATADAAVALAPSVRHVIVVNRLDAEVGWHDGRDLWWHELVDGRAGEQAPRPLPSEHPFLLGYTSGTTGRPKGIVHVHGGFLVKIAAEVAYQADYQPGERLHWVTDMGWIMGPWLTVGTLALGGTILLFDGAPDYPDAGRLWRLAERHRIDFLGVSPTLIRALKARGDAPLEGVDLSRLRLFGSTGEPWNSEPYLWLFERVGGGKRPIVNISGGTEIVCLLAAAHVLPHKPCTLGRPALGMDVDVFDAEGRPLRGALGELVCKTPWPSMARTIWGDHERYLDAYWRTYDGVWRHGDWASVDEDGDWFLHGRSDDTLNIAGKRIGPAEYESALVEDPDVIEACAVGVPDGLKGEVVWCFAVLAPGVEPANDLRRRLRQRCIAALGRAFAPAEVRFVETLPRTRSAKIVRRAVRAAVVGEDPGDLSTLEDPAALDAVREAR